MSSLKEALKAVTETCAKCSRSYPETMMKGGCCPRCAGKTK